MDIELLTFTLAANASAVFERGGRNIEILKAESPIASIVLTDASGAQVSFMRNPEASLFAKLAFKRIDVLNGPVQQTITLLVTDGEAGSRRLTGIVSVADAGRAIVLANRSFSAGASRLLGAGMPVVQVFNPVGSGRRAVVRGFWLEATAACSLFYGWNSATYNTVTNGKSRLSGGAESNSVIQTGDAANQGVALPITGQVNQVNTVLANVRVEQEFLDPVVLLPGFGFLLTASIAVGQSIQGYFDWNEELI